VCTHVLSLCSQSQNAEGEEDFIDAPSQECCQVLVTDLQNGLYHVKYEVPMLPPACMDGGKATIFVSVFVKEGGSSQLLLRNAPQQM
jgi:hypothetical protein